MYLQMFVLCEIQRTTVNQVVAITITI